MLAAYADPASDLPLQGKLLGKDVMERQKYYSQECFSEALWWHPAGRNPGKKYVALVISNEQTPSVRDGTLIKNSLYALSQVPLPNSRPYSAASVQVYNNNYITIC